MGESPKTEQGGYLADPAWLEAHRNDPKVMLVEIAGMGKEQIEAYRTVGHIPGAHYWPWQSSLWDERERDFPSPQDFARRLGAAGIGHDTTVVFYGEGVQFGLYAWWTFVYCGHTNVKILDGARYRWRAEGRALTKDEPPPALPVEYAPRPRNEKMRIGREEVLAALGQPGKIILDARSPEEYSGARVGGPEGPDVGAVRYGRIPGAKHLYFEDLLDADKRFKPREELRKLFESRGAVPGKDIITYCRMSHRATVHYFTLVHLLGYDNVRVYDGSWTEWGNLVGVPVER